MSYCFYAATHASLRIILVTLRNPLNTAPHRYFKEIHELIPNSTLVIIPGVNHDVVIGKRITLAKTIDKFLQDS